MCFRLHLKGKVFKVFSAATPEEMKELADNLKKIDSECDINLLFDTSKPCPKPSGKMKQFINKHCKAGQYMFSIKRCLDASCVCGQPKMPPDDFKELHQLPYPVPQRDHYKAFEIVIFE